MRQVIQSYKTGEVSLWETPTPRAATGAILVRNQASLISLGTERSTIELGRKTLVGKAVARPDLVKRAVEKAKRDGLKRTFTEAMGRLDTPTPLGYSSAGVVVEAGEAAHGFKPGDRVACVGQGYASHAEFVAVPKNLAARIPDNVSFEEASFGMLGVIALHGVRSAKLQFGETVAVLGLGLLGLLTVQLLKAYGCRVVAMDLAADKVALARTLGADVAETDATALEAAALAASNGRGCDAVIIAAATKSDAPVHTAVKLCRQKGRIVVVGVTDLHPHRNDMWLKEVELVVSKAGGPGALDPTYEQDGVDLPVGEVRWTQNRNLEEFLRLIADRRIDVARLITHRFEINEAERAYKALVAGELGGAIGIVLQYSTDAVPTRIVAATGRALARKDGAIRIGMLGAGLFGRSILLPALSKTGGVELEALAAATAASAAHSAKRFGFRSAATDAAEVFTQEDVDAVIAATPHDQHAWAVHQAIKHAKALFLEKPLCVTPDELAGIRTTFAKAKVKPVLMVGHQRRYSPHTRQLVKWLAGRTAPLVMSIRVNAGFIPADHWVHAEKQGRSRIVGEMTHFLDLVCVLADAGIRRVHAVRVAGDNHTVVNNDNLVVSLEMEDGSVASLAYSAQGTRSTPREQIEIWSGGSTITSVDFTRSTLVTAVGKTQTLKTSGAQAGYVEELAHFVDAARGVVALTPEFATAMHVMAAAFAIEASLASGQPVTLTLP